MQTTTATDIAAYLRELGMVRELIGAGSSEDSGAPESPGLAGGTAVPLRASATAPDAGPADLAWSKRPGAAASFGGSLLICSAEAAGELSGAAPLSEAGRLVIACARPRPPMALVVGRFFAHLAADGPPVYADPATARLVDEMRAWVKNAV